MLLVVVITGMFIGATTIPIVECGGRCREIREMCGFDYWPQPLTKSRGWYAWRCGTCGVGGKVPLLNIWGEEGESGYE